MTLLAAAQDRKEEVCDQMSKSLKDLGDRHPEMVLSSCCNFLQSNSSVFGVFSFFSSLFLSSSPFLLLLFNLSFLNLSAARFPLSIASRSFMS